MRMLVVMIVAVIFFISAPRTVSAFLPAEQTTNFHHSETPRLFLASNTLSTDSTSTILIIDPKERDAFYGAENMARYLVDLHDNSATFDFCGGMLFQLVLSQALREHLVHLANPDEDDHSSSNNNSSGSIEVAPARAYRMHQLESYERSAEADNRAIFHGREIRRVPWAKGGMGFVLQLSLATTSSNISSSSSTTNVVDPEGWTASEIAGYDGWGHDSGRDWRTVDRLEQEGFVNVRSQFGADAFSLHHRFYLHWDSSNRLWLSAEDGCEGTPAAADNEKKKNNPIQAFFQGGL